MSTIKVPEGNDKTKPIDPLRRIFVPIEKRDVNGHWVFRTSDGKRYKRDKDTGVIRRVIMKTYGASVD